VSKTTAYKLLREDLKLFPYKIQFCQQLTTQNQIERKEFAEILCDKFDRKRVDVNKIIMSDEAHFQLTGYVNKQNYRVWRSDRPDTLEERLLHAKRVTVWAAVSADGLEDFQFIRDKTVNSKVYSRILKEFLSKAKSKDLCG